MNMSFRGGTKTVLVKKPMRRRGKVMKNSLSHSFSFLGLGLLDGCGGGNASVPPPAIRPQAVNELCASGGFTCDRL